jgi:hypothetical protein
VSSALSPIWTIAVAFIGAVASLSGVVIKSWLDRRSELLKSEAEVVRLKLQLQEQRRDRAHESIRSACASFLAEVQAIYQSTLSARKSRRQGLIEDADYRAALRAIGGSEGQVRLEEVRLLAPPNVEVAASLLWAHIRAHDVPSGREVRGESWVVWKEDYWRLRKSLIEITRQELEL